MDEWKMNGINPTVFVAIVLMVTVVFVLMIIGGIWWLVM